MYNFSPISQTAFLFYLLIPFVLAILLPQVCYQQMQFAFNQATIRLKNVIFIKSTLTKWSNFRIYIFFQQRSLQPRI